MIKTSFDGRRQNAIQTCPLSSRKPRLSKWLLRFAGGTTNGMMEMVIRTGLKGEEIPIAAQVVALADVYDALTSERCYKKAYSHEEALKMILEGQCGAFNPTLFTVSARNCGYAGK